MCRSGFMALILCCLLGSACSGPRFLSDSDATDRPARVTMTTVHFRVTEQALEWRCRIDNDSEQDIWLCEGTSFIGYNFDTYLTDAGRTLVIRRRADVPIEWQTDFPPTVSYSRLRPRQSQIVSVLLHLPVLGRCAFARPVTPDGAVYAERLVLEVGYHSGNLPQLLARAHEEAVEERRVRLISDPARNKFRASHNTPFEMFFFTMRNEGLPCREEQVAFLYGQAALDGAQVLRLEVDNQSVPYIGFPRSQSGPSPPYLGECTRIEIRFEPSMLDYFFACASEQDLISGAEKAYLRSERTAVLDDPNRVSRFATEASRCGLGGIVAESGTARVVGYRNNKPFASFTLHQRGELETDDRRRFYYDIPGFNMGPLIPQVRPFEMRIQCARNLKDLWFRLQWYHKIQAAASLEQPPEDVVYPAANEWCDLLVSAYRKAASLGLIVGPYACPQAGDGKCHYAMNPTCTPNSPPDTVLLFETRAGWNQHGGAELFTFDNHEPKGGCVLFSDGTVKFVRTEEELKQLRWR